MQKRNNMKQSVALAEHKRTGPLCSVGRPTATRPAACAPTVHAPGRPDCRQRSTPHSHAPGGRPAHTPTALQTTTTDASQQNNTGPLGGPVIH